MAVRPRKSKSQFYKNVDSQVLQTPTLLSRKRLKRIVMMRISLMYQLVMAIISPGLQ